MSVDQLSTVIGVILSVVGAGAALLVSVLGAARLFFVVETKQAQHAKELDEHSAALKEFNGPARAAHVELTGRVTNLEAQTSKLATIESVANLTAKVDRGFASLEDAIRSTVNHIDALNKEKNK
jgi:hypothetical protein